MFLAVGVRQLFLLHIAVLFCLSVGAVHEYFVFQGVLARLALLHEAGVHTQELLDVQLPTVASAVFEF